MSSPIDRPSEQASLPSSVIAIDHLAIAVPDLEAAITWFTTVLGFTLKERRETHGNATGMISAVVGAGPIDFVLLQGTSAQSQVSRYIDHYGPGVQHIALRVTEVARVAATLRENGLGFDTEVIEGSGLRQIFSTRDSTSGLMLELIERTGEGFEEQNVTSLFTQLEEKNHF